MRWGPQSTVIEKPVKAVLAPYPPKAPTSKTRKLINQPLKFYPKNPGPYAPELATVRTELLSQPQLPHIGHTLNAT